MNRINSDVLARLEALFPGRVDRAFDFSAHSWWRIGGQAAAAVQPGSIDDVAALRRFAHAENLPTLTIGEMSNLLFCDDRVDALVLRMGSALSDFTRINSHTVRIEGGAWVPCVARRLQRAGLSGLEHICGIPGTLGGLVMMNGGSLRQSIGDRIVSVTSVDRCGEIVTRTRAQCEFAYRHSVFSELDEIIVAATLRLEPGDSREIRRTMQTILQARRLKFPRKLPNCGSVFKSNPASYAEHGPPGAIIEQAGWKGVVRGDAQVSPLHANFIINRGAARATHVLGLIGDIQQSVLRRTGHELEPEVRFVDSYGRIWRADEAYRQQAWKAAS